MKLFKKLNINKENIIKYSKLIIDKIITFIKDYKYIFFLALPFISMDIITRLFGRNINFYKLFSLSPNMFTITWIVLFLGLTLGFKKRIGKIIYLVINLIFLIVFLTNNVYYSMTKTFFDFSLLESASEGSPYIMDTLLNTNLLVYISCIFIIVLTLYVLKYIPYKTKNNYRVLSITFLVFLVMHLLTPLTLGKAYKELTWSSWRNPRNIYNSFNDNNKSMKISGLYEYTIRNFYITFLKTEEQENSEDITFLDDSYIKNTDNFNKYTGLFKDKNLIFIQFEGLDDWLLTEETTPTIYSMLNNSIVFNNHYSYYNGGGSTFNSEFAVNTGFITPLSYTQNAYTFNKNSFPYSMANLFKNIGYTINAFHMNTGEYYSRTTNYQNWGYDNYYGLIDINDFKDETYRLDRNLILNEKFNELLFNKDPNEKFVDYIITYSGHLPFTNTKGVCKMLYEEDINNLLLENPDNDYPFEEMSELDCIRRQAKETDYMMKLLLQKLEENNLLDNTVIVAFTDHYLYTIEDKTILDTYKETSNNLINKTPFFIWSKDMKQTKVNKVTSQLNILPTTLNLFGIEYSSNNYIGTDALSQNYEGIVFFSDYSWFDGNVYVENGEVINNKYISESSLEEKNYYISYITKKNDLTLKYNYFKHHK
mgnify:FL=1